MPKSKQVIESIRRRFLAKNPNMFHPIDVDRVKTNDWPIVRFLLANKIEDTAFAALIKTMEWRKSYGVNDFTDESFPEEVFKIGETFRHRQRSVSQSYLVVLAETPILIRPVKWWRGGKFFYHSKRSI